MYSSKTKVIPRQWTYHLETKTLLSFLTRHWHSFVWLTSHQGRLGSVKHIVAYHLHIDARLSCLSLVAFRLQEKDNRVPVTLLILKTSEQTHWRHSSPEQFCGFYWSCIKLLQRNNYNRNLRDAGGELNLIPTELPTECMLVCKHSHYQVTGVLLPTETARNNQHPGSEMACCSWVTACRWSKIVQPKWRQQAVQRFQYVPRWQVEPHRQSWTASQVLFERDWRQQLAWYICPSHKSAHQLCQPWSTLLQMKLLTSFNCRHRSHRQLTSCRSLYSSCLLTLSFL